MNQASTRLADLTLLLDRMAAKAKTIGITGTAAAAWHEPGADLVSLARGCGRMFSPTENLLAIAGSKLAEMADTGRDSGSGIRKPATGEFGYQGGALKKSGPGFYLAAFSGASGEDDVLVARYALEAV